MKTELMPETPDMTPPSYRFMFSYNWMGWDKEAAPQEFKPVSEEDIATAVQLMREGRSVIINCNMFNGVTFSLGDDEKRASLAVRGGEGRVMPVLSISDEEGCGPLLAAYRYRWLDEGHADFVQVLPFKSRKTPEDAALSSKDAKTRPHATSLGSSRISCVAAATIARDGEPWRRAGVCAEVYHRGGRFADGGATYRGDLVAWLRHRQSVALQLGGCLDAEIFDHPVRA